MPVSQRLQQSRIIMVGKFIDDQYANQVRERGTMQDLDEYAKCRKSSLFTQFLVHGFTFVAQDRAPYTAVSSL